MTGRIWKAVLAAITALLAAFFLLLMLLPLVSLFQFSGLARIVTAMRKFQGWDSVNLSLETTGLTALLSLIVGTPVAFVISRLRDRRLMKLVNLLCQLPIALPPSVAGLALLLLFGKNGMVGQMLAKAGVQVVFTPAAVVIAQFFVACPLFIQIVRTVADQVPEELYEAALVSGADEFRTIIRYIIPMLRPSIVSGLLVTYIRALGEFGATILFAGNMTGVTSTMPLHIYTLMQSDVRYAAAFSLVLIGLAAILMALLRGVFGRPNT